MTAHEAALALRQLNPATLGAFRLAVELVVYFAGLPETKTEPVDLFIFTGRRGGSNPGPRPPWTPERRAKFAATMERRRR